jgi:predicted nucleic acid-binding Zn ribbon protein
MPGARGITTVFDDWASVVGETTAAHTQPRSIDRGTLIVATTEPAVASQLRFLERELLARLAAICGEGRITSIAVTVEARKRRRS